jgi:glycine hydroxymethyltransferase
MIAGGSAYSRVIHFARFLKIADEVGAIFWVYMAHFACLVAGGVYPSPLSHAHVVTMTTHKMLCWPRGWMILSNDADLWKKLNSAVFPGLQGGPLMHTIAAKAVAFGKALCPSFLDYSACVVANARSMSEVLVTGGLDIVSGWTDSHVVLVYLHPKGLTGKATEASLERAGITCNKNAVPYDPEKPFVTSGVHLGTPAITTRGLGPVECKMVGDLIIRVVDCLVANGAEGNWEVEKQVREEVRLICKRFQIYTTGVPLDLKWERETGFWL